MFQSVAFFEPYKTNKVAETISMNMGTGGPPPKNKKLNNATNKIVLQRLSMQEILVYLIYYQTLVSITQK